MSIKNDEFSDGVLAGFWADLGNRTPVESGNKITMSPAPGEQTLLKQASLALPLDVWLKVVLPASGYNDTSCNIQCNLEDWGGAASGDIGVILAWDYGEGADFQLGAWSFADGGGEYYETYQATSGVRVAYLRLTADGSTCDAYYSLSYPRADSDWTKFNINNVVKWQPASGDIDLYVYGNPDGTATLDLEVHFIRNWLVRKAGGSHQRRHRRR